MFRNTAQKVTLFKPTNPLPFVKGAIAIPSRSASSLNVAYKRDQNAEEIWSGKRASQAKLSEEEVRRFVVGLSTMLQDGKLRPPTSREQVISHFAGQNYDKVQVKHQVANQVDDILSKKTKVIKRKHDNTSVLEWIY
ncbi:hypothetical protein V8B55DRAFT_1432167 [Mucor lusitanicus]|uniref:Uncharacterized protein n=1 Tax=Mucor lusitanicus CBS 277.49 TaxID=747725 RepID=A0A168PBZ3_MUCCL|nr:hypothetical protein MUCCIDRAFT_77533 [Mucor lusitanicus CBS 277.49]